MRTLMMATVLLLLASCGSDKVALEDYAAALRDANCRWLVKCGEVESLATCRTINIGSEEPLSASVLAAVDMDKLTYDSDSVARCFDALASSSCDSTSESARVIPESCRSMFLGPLQGGAACVDGRECISQICDVAPCNEACCMGTCVGDTAPGNAKIGESCEHAFCENASFCDEVTLVCTALKPQGAFCASPAECRFGLDCDQNAECSPLPGPGEACTSRCRDVGTTCSSGSNRTCVKVALAGEACTVPDDCALFYNCAMGSCAGGPALGAACRSGQRCGAPGAFCDVAEGQPTGTCTLPKADGSACRLNSHCESFFCDSTTGMCAPQPICI